MEVMPSLLKVFPKAVWTGGSHIHGSYASAFVVPASVPVKMLLHKLYQSGFGKVLFEAISKNFPDIEWMISPEEFSQICLVDYARILSGKPPSNSRKELVNPETKSRFHRMALKGGFVGGCRFFIANGGGVRHIAFRFRWERMVSEEDTVRASSRESVAEVEKEYAVMEKTFMEIPEPYSEKVKPQRITLH